MNTEKAYKLLAMQENISNNEAKNLIDRGLVNISGKRLDIARKELPANINFKVNKLEKPSIVFEDKYLVALEKPTFISSEELLKLYPNLALLHRLDKETSGIILLTKQEKFRQKAIEEFRQKRVYKEYIAVINGEIFEAMEINKPILTTKGNVARSRISKDGVEAISEISPLEMRGKKTLIKIVIKTGKTHQIRVHLQSINCSILGDNVYGGIPHNRLMLHSKKIKIFDYVIESKNTLEF